MKPTLSQLCRAFNEFAQESFTAMSKSDSDRWLKARKDLIDQLDKFGLSDYIEFNEGESE